MSLIDAFLLAGNDEVDSTFGTVTMTCNGQSFAVVWNGASKSYEGALGGLEGPVQATATAQPADVTNPLQMLQKRATVNGTTYRVAEVRVGTVAVEFTLADPSEAR